MPQNKPLFSGLSTNEVNASREKNGNNSLHFKKENEVLKAIIGLAKEPMVILLFITSCIYFLSGKTSDGIFLATAILLVSGISLFQDSRSRNALEELKDFSQPKSKVIRNGNEEEIISDEIVLGDFLILEEGTHISADGIIIQANDFSVNESILTGESLAVFKDQLSQDNLVFRGCSAASGRAVARVTQIGKETRLGKIGKTLETIPIEKTPLEAQINQFVKNMVILGAVVFVLVWGINYLHTHQFLFSLTQALTLAMSILPEEIPVAFTTFMALGAWRLMKLGIVVKQMKTVETLGSASVICTDKTGTLTENRMSLVKIYSFQSRRISLVKNPLDEEEKDLIEIAMWASEPIPFDPMEVALHQAYYELDRVDQRPHFKLIHEYPLEGKPPMMTHLFENNKGKRRIAAKGAPEALLNISKLDPLEKNLINTALKELSLEGYRVLAVGEAQFDGNDFPEIQQKFNFSFMGLVAFYDPPKANISSVIKKFYQAGIKVKIITGDNAETTQSIARQIDFQGFDRSINGADLVKLSPIELKIQVEEKNIFTRMFPEAKLKIIDSLKENKEIVAMTGDGVNDGLALKAAHIGIAMGKKGTEIAKQAAALILLEDDLSKIVDAVAMGRRIYSNLKKAIQYIISIHIPIVLTVFIPLALGWRYPNIFSPIHIIFLELIMGPTCSIIYENEPIEKNTMFQKPRPFTSTFFNWKELITSVIQGLVISLGTMATYQFAVKSGYDENLTRTMVFTCLISANIFLTLVNRSFYYSILTSLRNKNNLVTLIIVLTLIIFCALVYIKPLSDFFGFEFIPPAQLGISMGIGFLSVIWFEGIKFRNRLSINPNSFFSRQNS